MIGKTLGHYEVIESLGAGGMGEVYRATATKLQRDVAIKVLPAHLADGADGKRRDGSLSEARTLRRPERIGR